MKPSDSKKRVRERVQLHRLRERLRPKTLREADENVYEIINRALILMDAVQAGLRNPQLIAKQDEAMELQHKLDSSSWENANRALILMSAAKAGLRNLELVAKQNEAMELLRQLSWEPEEEY